MDLNHDGRLDSVIAAPEPYGSQTIQVKLDGVGERDLECNCWAGPLTVIYAADVNGDSNLDLVRESGSASWSATVWLGDGNGNFALSSAPGSDADDFFTLPAGPYCPSSTQGPQSASWVASATTGRQSSSRVRKPRTNRRPRVAAEPRAQCFRRDTPVPSRRELLYWIARTINAPPYSPTGA